MIVKCREILITGRVQGVGFRPFIARLANSLSILGWVRNEGSFVRIVAQANATQLDQLQLAITQKAPPAASPAIQTTSELKRQHFTSFNIASSKVASDDTLPELPLDLYCCPDCINELFDPENPRYRYPFINCTQCGPRYTLIETLPYDRPSTTMSVFKMCEACESEYLNPIDRRFHAEPTACPECGPELIWSGEKSDSPLALAVCAIKNNQVISVKGLGGFHLITSAFNETGIHQIRALKGRPDKPLAVLFSDQPDHPAYYQHYIEVDSRSDKRLNSVTRPIVLCPNNNRLLAKGIHPSLNHLGAMLPYTPLHSLLLADIDFPLVVTSANRKGEPIAISNNEAQILTPKTCLSHDRDILYPVDDSVFLARGLPVRLGRGHTPKTGRMPFKLKSPIVALGAEDKITFALAKHSQWVLSPHLGSLATPASQANAQKTLTHLSRLFDIPCKHFVIDKHPQYSQRRFLAKQGISDWSEVQHHTAHASALWLEAWQNQEITDNDKLLVFVWDGTGFGEDGSLWGGETFYGRPGQWQRVASLNPFALPGGESCIFEPWRVALSLYPQADFSTVTSAEYSAVQQLLEKQLNCIKTSSAGRLLDACGALLGIERVSFDAYAAMQLNDLAAHQTGSTVPLSWQMESTNIARLDWQPLIQTVSSEPDPKLAAASVFQTLANAIIQFASSFKRQHAGIGFTGGVFQSDRLTESLKHHSTSLKLIFHSDLPANDASISIGQIIEIAGRQHDWQD